jgi:hypothetical protein
MKELIKVAVLCIILSSYLLGIVLFSKELKKESEIKNHRKEMRFKRDSLRLDINKSDCKVKC